MRVVNRDSNVFRGMIVKYLGFALLLCFSLPLISQGQRQGQNQRPGGRGIGDSLPVILNMVQGRPPASLILLDNRDTPLEAQVASMLRQDPLLPLNLNFIRLDAKAGAGAELILREGWTPGASRWCLMLPDGTVVFSSDKPPAPDMIVDGFRSVGLRSRAEVLQQFLSSYPEHAEARLALLGELRAVAETKTQNALGMTTTIRGGSQFNNNTPAPASEPQLLDSDIDLDIWGQYAKEADYVFQNGIWKQDTAQLWGRNPFRGSGMANIGSTPAGLFRGGGTSIVSSQGQYSPLMKKLYLRWLPDIEYALQKRPSSIELWDLWLVVQRVAGGRDLGALTASLAPSPNDRPEEIPSPLIRRDWIRDCINRQDWRMAEDVARGAWEALLEKPGSPNRGGQGSLPLRGGNRPSGGNSATLNTSAWSNVAEPYIEVLLRQQKASTADAIVQRWFSDGGWSGAAMRARNLANRLGFADMGSRWGNLAPVAK
ncbi:MAG: hypothetical protein FWG02_07310 [Holophagaceae bacterium]|nr:hypothetical protein [Holophagaceae bacterium]